MFERNDSILSEIPETTTTTTTTTTANNNNNKQTSDWAGRETMLNLTWCLRRYLSTSTRRFRDKEFLDSLLLCVQGGTGGKGGPKTGGQGGDGGSVFLKGDSSTNLENVEENFADVGIVRAGRTAHSLKCNSDGLLLT